MSPNVVLEFTLVVKDIHGIESFVDTVTIIVNNT